MNSPRPLAPLATLAAILRLWLSTSSDLSADQTPHVLANGSFSQNWSNAALITTSDDWGGVPSIVGYRGDDLTTTTGVDPRTVLVPSTVVDVNANQTAPDTFSTGGVTEFAITNPTIALAGSGTADAPYISVFLDTRGVGSITVAYNLRDIDGSVDNAAQAIALQYRIGSSGNFTDVPAGYVADASSGPSQATLVTPVSVVLPSAVGGNALVEIRIITTNAGGNDEWIGIDDIAISVGDSLLPTATAFAPLDNATNVPVTTTPAVTFNEAVQKGTGNIVIKRSSDNSTLETIAVSSAQITVNGSLVTITPSASLANSTGYYIEITAGAIKDLAGNDYAGVSGATAWNFTTSAPAAQPTATETFVNGWKVGPTGASIVADYYAEGNGQANFARFDVGVFNFTRLDFGLSGASQITGVTTAEFTLRQNNRSFTTGTQFEFFLTTDGPTGKTFNPAIANGIDPSQFNNAPVSLGQFSYTPTTSTRPSTPSPSI